MSIMMAVDLLGCTGSTEERAALLHKTIQLAAELKSSMGNMFGFAAVMRALELPQVRHILIQIVFINHQKNIGSLVYTYCCNPSDFPSGADVGDVAAETHRGRYSVREETQTFSEKYERWQR